MYISDQLVDYFHFVERSVQFGMGWVGVNTVLSDQTRREERKWRVGTWGFGGDWRGVVSIRLFTHLLTN